MVDNTNDPLYNSLDIIWKQYIMQYTDCTWNPIDTYEPGFNQVLLSNDKHKWIRFGFKYPGINRWYYSTTTETSRYGSNDEPTHWMYMLKGPW